MANLGSKQLSIRKEIRLEFAKNIGLEPIETLKNSRFLNIEVANQVIGYPYSDVRKYDWRLESQEVLTLHFDDVKVILEGTGLRKILPLLQTDELFVLRVGNQSGLFVEKIRLLNDASTAPR